MATWVCAARDDLPIDDTRDWDGGEASQSIWEWAGFNDDRPDPERARQGFLLYDTDAPELKGSYSLPFAMVIDGELTALMSGCRAAASRLPQKEGVGDDEREAARAVLDAYFARNEGDGEEGAAAEDEREPERSRAVGDLRPEGEVTITAAPRAQPPPEPAQPPPIRQPARPRPARSATPTPAPAPPPAPRPERRQPSALSTRFIEQGAEGAVFPHPAAIIDGSVREASDELQQLAERQALDPSIFTDHPPYFWQAEISSTRLDSYYTRMSPRTTLRNYAVDAQAGVSFQNSHSWFELPLGRSISGQFIGPGGNGLARTLADFYTVSGLRLGTVDTDNFLVGLRSGIVRDVSVGFSGGKFICSLCGRDMLRDWECPHIPGFFYETGEEASPWPVAESERAALATATIEDTRLVEVRRGLRRVSRRPILHTCLER